MNTINIQALVVTTPEELERGGETYATMSRTISIPVQPHVGMLIVVNPFGHMGEKTKRWESLIQALHGSNVGGFMVKSIALAIGDIGGQQPDQITAFISLNELFEPTLDRFRAHIHILEQFYGFERV